MYANVVISNGAVSSVQLSAGANEQTQCIIDGLKTATDAKAQNAVVDECAKAPNPLVPAKNELIWGTIGFVVVFVFIVWKGFPAIKKTMQARSDKIRTDLETAESAKTEATSVLITYQAQLADAKAESNRIIDEARLQADAVRRDLQARAEADIADLRVKAAADIESAKNRAVADLQGQVKAIAFGAAEKVVLANIDRDANSRLVDDFIASVGAGK